MSGSQGARDQVLRLLALVPLLREKGSFRLAHAAKTLGVSEGQVIKDLKVLWMCGLPGGLPDDLIDVDLDALEGENAQGIIRISNVDYLTRPLRLTPREASAIVLALRAVRDGVPEAGREVVDRALAKLESAFGDAAAMETVAAPGEARVGELRAQAERAIADGLQLSLRYYVPTRDEVTERVVDPRRVVTREGAVYLDAYCHLAEDDRLFRLDRVEELTVLASPITAPPRTSDTDELFSLGDGETVTLRLAAEARWVPEYYPVESVRSGPDGTLEVTLVAADPLWLDRLLLRLAGWVEVLGPEHVAQRHQENVRRTLAQYS